MPYPMAAARGKIQNVEAVAPFSPTDISGLALWLDADDITTLFQDSGKTTPITADAQTVGAWADKSGNGNDALQSTGSAEPTYKTGIRNGKPVIRFDGTSDFFNDIAKGSNWSGVSIFVVLVSDTNAAERRLLDNPSASIVWARNNSGTFQFFDYVAGPTLTTASVAIDTDWHYLSMGIGNSDKTARIWKDGVAGTAGSTLTGTLLVIGTAETSIHLGRTRDSADRFWDGDVAEILIYDTLLSTGNRQSVESYLAAKWGFL